VGFTELFDFTVKPLPVLRSSQQIGGLSARHLQHIVVAEKSHHQIEIMRVEGMNRGLSRIQWIGSWDGVTSMVFQGGFNAVDFFLGYNFTRTFIVGNISSAADTGIDRVASTSCACRKSNSHIQMKKSAKKWRRQNAANGMYCSRRRRVLVD